LKPTEVNPSDLPANDKVGSIEKGREDSEGCHGERDISQRKILSEK